MDAASARDGIRCLAPGVSPDSDTGVRELMRAVLLDAILCLRKRSGPPREAERLATQARFWIASTSRSWPFSFESVCDVLGLSATYMRRVLLHPLPSAAGLRAAEGVALDSMMRRLSVLRRRGNRITRIALKRKYPRRKQHGG